MQSGHPPINPHKTLLITVPALIVLDYTISILLAPMIQSIEGFLSGMRSRRSLSVRLLIPRQRALLLRWSRTHQNAEWGNVFFTGALWPDN